MDKILYFDYCAITIDALVLITILYRKMTKGITNKALLLFALASWIGHIVGNLFIGFLIMGILLLLLMALVYAKRKAWVIQPLSRLVVGLFIHDEEGEEATP